MLRRKVEKSACDNGRHALTARHQSVGRTFVDKTAQHRARYRRVAAIIVPHIEDECSGAPDPVQAIVDRGNHAFVRESSNAM